MMHCIYFIMELFLCITQTYISSMIKIKRMPKKFLYKCIKSSNNESVKKLWCSTKWKFEYFLKENYLAAVFDIPSISKIEFGTSFFCISKRDTRNAIACRDTKIIHNLVTSKYQKFKYLRSKHSKYSLHRVWKMF